MSRDDVNETVANFMYSGPRCYWDSTWLRCENGGLVRLSTDARWGLASVAMDCHYPERGLLLVGLEKSAFIEPVDPEQFDVHSPQYTNAVHVYARAQNAHLRAIKDRHEARLRNLIGRRMTWDEFSFLGKDPLLMFEVCDPMAIQLNELVWKLDRGETLTPNRWRRR